MRYESYNSRVQSRVALRQGLATLALLGLLSLFLTFPIRGIPPKVGNLFFIYPIPLAKGPNDLFPRHGRHKQDNTIQTLVESKHIYPTLRNTTEGKDNGN